jgi:hypothetical protein
MDRIFRKVIECEVLPKDGHRQIPAWQLTFPIVVVCERVAVNGLIDSAMHAEIRLPIAIQIELTQSDPAVDRFLEDSRTDACPMPLHFAGKPGIEGYYLHLPPVLIRCVRMKLLTGQYSERLGQVKTLITFQASALSGPSREFPLAQCAGLVTAG